MCVLEGFSEFFALEIAGVGEGCILETGIFLFSQTKEAGKQSTKDSEIKWRKLTRERKTDFLDKKDSMSSVFYQDLPDV